jgi:hypothetical protein
MTASIFVGGKPIDGKLILSDDWRKVRDMKLCLSVLRSGSFRSFFEEARQPGRALANSSRNFFLLFFFFLPSFSRRQDHARDPRGGATATPHKLLLYKITKLLLF